MVPNSLCSGAGWALFLDLWDLQALSVVCVPSGGCFDGARRCSTGARRVLDGCSTVLDGARRGCSTVLDGARRVLEGMCFQIRGRCSLFPIPGPLAHNLTTFWDFWSSHYQILGKSSPIHVVAPISSLKESFGKDFKVLSALASEIESQIAGQVIALNILDLASV